MRVSRVSRLADAFALLVGFCSAALGQSESLPPKVEADLLNRQVVEAYSAANWSQVLMLVEQYRALEPKGVKVPLPLVLVEAEAAAATKDTERALRALTRYLNASTPSDSGYDKALALYPQYQSADAPRAAEAAKQAERAEMAAAAEKRAKDAAAAQACVSQSRLALEASKRTMDVKKRGKRCISEVYPDAACKAALAEAESAASEAKQELNTCLVSNGGSSRL
jgi:hypothetical protein